MPDPDACLSFLLSFFLSIKTIDFFFLAFIALIELVATRRSQHGLRIILLSAFLSVTYLFLAFLV